MTDAQAKLFRKIVEEMLKRNDEMSQTQLSHQTNYSKAAISLLLKGDRNLTEDFADSIAHAIGGTGPQWKAIFDEIKEGSGKSAEAYLSKLSVHKAGRVVNSSKTSTRLVNQQIYELFSEGANKTQFKEYLDTGDPCAICDFDPTRIQPTSYDTRLGSVGKASLSKVNYQKNGFEEVEGELQIKPMHALSLRTKEHFEMPRFLEVDISPASTLDRKPLHIGMGHIIDPNFNGYLTVDARNLSDETVTITTDEAFLTVRFTLLDTLPLSDAEMHRQYGVARYNKANQT